MSSNEALSEEVEEQEQQEQPVAETAARQESPPPAAATEAPLPVPAEGGASSMASANGSVVEIPGSNPETSIWALFQPAVLEEVKEASAKASEDLGTAKNGVTTTTQDTADNLIREFVSYSQRLEHHEGKLNGQVDSLCDEQQQEEEEMQSRLAEEERLLEESLKAQYGQMAAPLKHEQVNRMDIPKPPPPAAPTKKQPGSPPRSSPLSSPRTRGLGDDEDEEGDCKKVIDFWKTKHAELEETFNAKEIELGDMGNQLNDIRYLQNSTDQDLFKTHRLIGLLREREAAERLKADAYSKMLHELVVPSGHGKTHGTTLTADGAGELDATRSGTNPALSAIEEALIKSELEGVHRAGTEIEALRQILLQAQERRTTRLDEIRDRLDVTITKMTNRQGFSLDETLAEVMEMRDEAQRITEMEDEEKEKEANAASKAMSDEERFAQELMELREEEANAKAQSDNIGKQLLEQLRECKVESIRTMYRSCGDVDSTFQRLKVEQQINILTGSLHKAQAQSSRMKHQVNETEDNVRMNSDFLAKCK